MLGKKQSYKDHDSKAQVPKGENSIFDNPRLVQLESQKLRDEFLWITPLAKIFLYSFSSIIYLLPFLSRFAFWTCSITHFFLQFQLPIIHERLDHFGTTAICFTFFLTFPFYNIDFGQIIQNSLDKSIKLSCRSRLISLAYISTLLSHEGGRAFTQSMASDNKL